MLVTLWIWGLLGAGEIVPGPTGATSPAALATAPEASRNDLVGPVASRNHSASAVPAGSAVFPVETLYPFGDLPAYWVAGHCFWERRNSYDPAEMHFVEAREKVDHAFVIWNPPWIFALLAPLAALPYGLAGRVFTFGMGFLAAACGWVLGQRLGLRPFIAVVATILFPPVWGCVGFCQWTLLIFAGFLWYTVALAHQRPFLAGLGLVFCSLKPHLLALLWPALLVRGTWRERMGTWAGFAVGIAALLTFVLAHDPAVPSRYLHAIAHPPEHPPTAYLAATVGVMLRWLSGQLNWVWLQFIPLALAVGPFTGWAARDRGSVWRFMGITTWVSCLVLPYGWHYDQVILLPLYLWLIREMMGPQAPVPTIETPPPASADAAPVATETSPTPERPAWSRWVLALSLLLLGVGQGLGMLSRGNEWKFVFVPLVLTALAFFAYATRYRKTRLES